MSKQKDRFAELTPVQRRWAEEQVKRFETLKVAIPYGIIIIEAKKNFSDN